MPEGMAALARAPASTGAGVATGMLVAELSVCGDLVNGGPAVTTQTHAYYKQDARGAGVLT